MRRSEIFIAFALSISLAGCGLLGMDTPGQAALEASLKAETDAQTTTYNAAAAKSKAESDAAVAYLNSLPAGPTKDRAAANMMGFTNYSSQHFENGKLVKSLSYQQGVYQGPTTKFTLRQDGLDESKSNLSVADCSSGTSDPCYADEYHSFSSEAQFARFIKDCQVVDKAWRALK